MPDTDDSGCLDWPGRRRSTHRLLKRRCKPATGIVYWHIITMITRGEDEARRFDDVDQGDVAASLPPRSAPAAP